MTPKLLPTTLILGCTALLAFAFVLPSNTPQSAATAYAQSVPQISFAEEEISVEEGEKILLKVELEQPITRTTRVTVKLTPDRGTTSRDIRGLTSTKSVTFYAGGLTSKTISLQTIRTSTTADKGLTAIITKVGNVTIPAAEAETTRVTIYDQNSTGDDDPLANNNNQNQNNNTTGTTTPLIDCKPYEGVIPGKSQKYSIENRTFAKMVLNPRYGFSAEAQRELELMQGDAGLNNLKLGVPQVPIMHIPASTVLSYKFKTTEYNFPFSHSIQMDERPGSGYGTTIMSVSLCPGDFTSPWVTAQKGGFDVTNEYGDEKFRHCISKGPLVGNRLDFGHGSGDRCQLESNKTYYFNLAVYDVEIPSEAGSGSLRPHMVNYATSWKPRIAGEDGVSSWFDVVKNRTAFYAEMRRARAQFEVDRRQQPNTQFIYSWK